MKDHLVPIDQAGRLVLPKNIREELAIKPGDVLKLSIQGTSVILERKAEKLAGFQKKGKALVFSSDSGEIFDQTQVERILRETRETTHDHIEKRQSE